MLGKWLGPVPSQSQEENLSAITECTPGITGTGRRPHRKPGSWGSMRSTRCRFGAGSLGLRESIWSLRGRDSGQEGNESGGQIPTSRQATATLSMAGNKQATVTGDVGEQNLDVPTQHSRNRLSEVRSGSLWSTWDRLGALWGPKAQSPKRSQINPIDSNRTSVKFKFRLRPPGA